MIPALLLVAAAAVQTPGAAEWPHPAAQHPDRLRADLAFLASDELQGRDTGSFGAEVAAAWIEARFRRLGLQPLEGLWTQEFPAAPLHLDPATGLSWSSPDGEARRRVDAGEDLLPHPMAPAGRAAGEVVFAGYAITALEHGYDDLGGLDLRGRIALVLRWEPGADDEDSPFEGTLLTAHAALAAKVRRCQELGAAAVLIAPAPGRTQEADAPGAPYWPAFSPFFEALEPLVARQVDPAEQDRNNLTPRKVAEQVFCTLQASAPLGARIPVGMVSRREAERMVRASGRDLRAWVRETDEAGMGDGFPLGVHAELVVAHRPPRILGRNVFGFLPGSDPALREEVVVVGAHYDHVGANPDGRVWNGADDNGSGSAALLGVAEAIALSSEPPRRSVLFVAFSGEELGLLGARWFLASGLLPPERIAAMVNLDMIGRSVGGSVHVLGSESAEGLAALVDREAAGLGLRHDFENEQFFDRSDQAPFYFQGVPVLFFNTDEHPDYHQPSDTWEKIAYGTTARIGVLARRVASALAAADARPVYQDGYGRLRRRFGSRPELTIPFPVAFEDRLDY